MKKLVTIAWSTTVLMDLPASANLDSMNEIGGEHEPLAMKAIEDGWDNIRAKDGVITDVLEEAETLEELEEQNQRDGVLDAANEADGSADRHNHT